MAFCFRKINVLAALICINISIYMEKNPLILNFFFFVTGGSLDKYMPIPEAVLGRMAVYIIDGLVYMWNLSFLHRG